MYKHCIKTNIRRREGGERRKERKEREEVSTKEKTEPQPGGEEQDLRQHESDCLGTQPKSWRGLLGADRQDRRGPDRTGQDKT